MDGNFYKQFKYINLKFKTKYIFDCGFFTIVVLCGVS